MGKTEERLKNGAVPLFRFLELRIPPPVVFLVFAAITWLLAMALPAAGFVLPAKKLIATVLAAVGGVFAVAGILSFLRARTTISPADPSRSTVLVTTGVYSITRNPMYLSLLLVLAAWAIYLSNFAALALVPCFAAYLTRFQILPEERALTALFGSRFGEYRNRVRRWL